MILCEKEFVKKVNLRLWPKRVLALVKPAKSEFRQVCRRRVTAIIRLSVHSSQTIWPGKISGFFFLHISPFLSVIEIAIFLVCFAAFPSYIVTSRFLEEKYNKDILFNPQKCIWTISIRNGENICRRLRFS